MKGRPKIRRMGLSVSSNLDLSSCEMPLAKGKWVHIQYLGTNCCSYRAAKPCRRGQHKEGVTTEPSLHLCFSSHEVLEQKKGLETGGCGMVSGQYHTCRDGSAPLPPAPNVPGVACFSLLWQPGYPECSKSQQKKSWKQMQTSWSCFMQDVEPTNEPDYNQLPVACL